MLTTFGLKTNGNNYSSHKKIFILIGFLEGILYGLLLAVLVGPVFFKMLQTSVENGWKAAAILAAGQWFGDFAYIALVFWGSTYISALLTDDAIRVPFVFYLGTIGGSLLILLGVGMLRAAPPKNIDLLNTAPINSNGTLIMLFAQGFGINTINPFPIFFWITLMGSTISQQYSTADTIGIFFGTMSTVIVSDLAKIYLAKRIREWLKPEYVIYVRRIAGAALMFFGVILWVRALTA